MSDLERCLRDLQSRSFPSTPDDDRLGAALAHMSELDSELKRLAVRIARSDVVRAEDVPVIRGLVSRLNGIDDVSEEDAEVYAAAVDYLEALASLREALLAAAITP